jgi:iron complex transport system permease protein
MFLQKRSKKRIMFYIFFIIFILTAIFSSTLGAANISFKESLYIILKNIPGLKSLLTGEVLGTHNLIITKIRLPRILTASLVGMGLSVVGTSFQAMFKNPMADPYVLGISSGAALGGALALVMGISERFLGLGAVTLFAFIGALLTTFLVYNIARVGNKIPTTTLLLAGVAVSYFMSAIISMIMVFNRQAVEKIVFWTMGSLATSNWNTNIILLIVIFVGSAIIYYFNKDLNILLTGDDSARSLGVNVEKVKKILLVVASLIVAAAVSFCGIIGFVGLIVPHAMRMFVGPNHKYLIPFSALGGAFFLLICDTLARTIAAPSELPVGAITALFGAPYFAYLLIKNKKKVS